MSGWPNAISAVRSAGSGSVRAGTDPAARSRKDKLVRGNALLEKLQRGVAQRSVTEDTKCRDRTIRRLHLHRDFLAGLASLSLMIGYRS